MVTSVLKWLPAQLFHQGRGSNISVPLIKDHPYSAAIHLLQSRDVFVEMGVPDPRTIL